MNSETTLASIYASHLLMLQDIVAKFALDHYCSKIEDQPFNGHHNCLANIVATLVTL